VVFGAWVGGTWAIRAGRAKLSAASSVPARPLSPIGRYLSDALTSAVVIRGLWRVAVRPTQASLWHGKARSRGAAWPSSFYDRRHPVRLPGRHECRRAGEAAPLRPLDRLVRVASILAKEGMYQYKIRGPAAEVESLIATPQPRSGRLHEMFGLGHHGGIYLVRGSDRSGRFSTRSRRPHLPRHLRLGSRRFIRTGSALMDERPIRDQEAIPSRGPQRWRASADTEKLLTRRSGRDPRRSARRSGPEMAVGGPTRLPPRWKRHPPRGPASPT
jgi:hypothetical protein